MVLDIDMYFHQHANWRRTLDGAKESKRQKEQLDRYLSWVSEEGGTEGPTHLDTWFKPHQHKRLEWLKSHSTGVTAEFGCNYGYVLAYCGGHIGVDWNKSSIRLAEILNPARKFITADIRRLPLPALYADTVMLCDVLEHLRYPVDVELAVAEAMRVARAKVLITLPNGEHDTPESNSFKHQWLATSDKVKEIVAWLRHWKISVSKTRHFVMIEAVRVKEAAPDYVPDTATA